MKAVGYGGPRTVSVKEVPDARVERPTDALARITTQAALARPRRRRHAPPAR